MNPAVHRLAAVALIVLAAVALIPTTPAGTAKDYAYLSVQGKLTEDGDGRAIVGAVVTLSSTSERFRAVTDDRGVYGFNKLPLAEYTVAVRTTDGETIRNVRRFETRGRELTMLHIRVGRGGPGPRAPGPIIIDASSDPLDVKVPNPRTKWERLWKQGLVFVALSTAVALGL